MKRVAIPEAKIVAGCVLVAVASAWLGFSGLAALAKPGQLGGRLARLEPMLRAVERAPRAAGDPSSYAPHAICRTGSVQAGEQLKARIAAAAAEAGLPAPKLALSPPDVEFTTDRLAPVMFQADVTGRYDAVLQFLKLMAEGEPQVFADTMDLKSETSVVSLHFTGRVLCSTSAV